MNDLDFKPIWVFVASWVNVEPYRNKNPLLKNTFQMILFTDGTATYVYYQYFYLAWPSYDLPKNIQVGYNFNKKHSFIQKNFEFTKFSLNTSRLKSGKMLTELLYGSNMNQAGKWIYRLDKNGRQFRISSRLFYCRIIISCFFIFYKKVQLKIWRIQARKFRVIRKLHDIMNIPWMCAIWPNNYFFNMSNKYVQKNCLYFAFVRIHVIYIQLHLFF